MNIGSIDESATLGTSWLHTASPVAKLVAFALLLAAAIVSWNILVIASVTVLLSAAVASARVRPKLAFGLAAYPAIFALIFAFASAPDVITGSVIVLKAVTASLAAVTVILTTPYPQVFAPIQRIVPTIVGDSLLMTYRSAFLLLDKMSNLLRAVRLRAGLATGGIVRSARLNAAALGGLLLYSLDLSQRDYDIMRVRGYQERLRTTLPRSASRVRDTAMIAGAGLMLSASVLWRLRADVLNPYSWLVPIVPLLLLAIVLLLRWRKAS